MPSLPTVRFANSEVQITRLISGGNPLVGNSHFTRALNDEMREYFTAEQVVAYLHALQKAGINTLQARGDYHRILHWMELFRADGGQLHWIAQTASEMHDVFQNIRILAQAGTIGIYHHGTQTDALWFEGRINEVEDYLKCIRDTGVQVGLGSHLPEVIEYSEEKGWDVDFYMTCFYRLAEAPRDSAVVVSKPGELPREEFAPDAPAAMCKVIRQTDKMCLAYKVLAAGRRCKTQDEVAEALRFAYANIKPKDAVVVGMFPKYTDQITLNVRDAIAACSNIQTKTATA